MACPAGYTFPSSEKRKYDPALDNLVPGDKFRYWDTEAIWTKDHVHPGRLEEIRTVGDKLSDDAYKVLNVKRKQDAAELLLAYVSRPESEQESPAPRLLLEQFSKVPDWVDMERVERGIEVQRRHILVFAYVAFFCSFIINYSSASATRVLKTTGYFTTGSKVLQNILENAEYFQIVFSSAANLLEGSKGWKATLQVRLLHSHVRARLEKLSKTHSKLYDISKLGTPINQEDLYIGLLILPTLTWHTMERRLGLVLSDQEREDYMHAWRYIGHMLGVEDVFGLTHSADKALAGLQSLMMHVFNPQEESGVLMRGLLKPLAFKIPILSSLGIVPDLFGVNLALSEKLVGSEIWEVARIPASSPENKRRAESFVN
ncbi:hypothetical protein BGZ76_010845, partial [Entomortierella beljakovae]